VMELCAYCTLFGVSMARNVGIPGISDACDITHAHSSECRGLYSFYIGLFWIWSMFISIQDFPAQAGYQTFSSIMRFFIMFVMLYTSIALMYSSYTYDGTSFQADVIKKPHYGNGVVAFDWIKVLSFFGIAGFAYGNQFCTSDVLAPLRPEDRNKQKNIVGSIITYLWIGFYTVWRHYRIVFWY